MSNDHLPAEERVVEVFITQRPGSIKMTLERAYEKFVKTFFVDVSEQDVWDAAQTQSGWQGTISGMFVSIYKADKIRDYDVVLK